MSPRISAILFDCDGVLVDSEPAHYESFRLTLGAEGLGLTFDDYLHRYLAFDDVELFRMAFEDAGRPLADDLLERLLDEKGRLLAERLAALPVVEASFRFARRALAEGWAVAVVSGARRHEVRSVIERGGMLAEIPVVLTTEDVERGKPDPEPYLAALAELNRIAGGEATPPSECLVIEDSLVGVRSGKAAGMRVLALTTSYDEEALAGADLVLPGLDGLDPGRVEEMLGP